MENIAKKLNYMGEVFKYSHAKNNILIYINQPHYYYEDWTVDGGILIVEYIPSSENDKYVVLHYLSVYQNTAHIEYNDISEKDKIAVPCE